MKFCKRLPSCWQSASVSHLLASLMLFAQFMGCSHASDTNKTLNHTIAEPSTTSEREVLEVPPERDPFLVRMRYLETDGVQQLTAFENLVVTTPDQGLKRLPSGSWWISHKRTKRATLAFSVYVRAFAHNETSVLSRERQDWREQGYSTFVTTLGRSLPGADGTIYDGRTYWLGIKRCSSAEEADALKEKLQGEKVWAWSREEVRSPSQGNVAFKDASGTTILTSPSPLRLRSTGAIAISGARPGKEPLIVVAPLDIALDRSGDLTIDGQLPIEVYLQGILPAEMYPDWPLEALKAQAVAARSEIIAHAGGKHYFDGFDFCIKQHCRAFSGDEGRHERTDQAVRETADLVLVNADNAIVPTVFSASCGGWTENNENVWDGAPNSALRGRSDQVRDDKKQSNGAVEAWIASTPTAHCAHDGKYYRWARSLSLKALSQKLDAKYKIGGLQRVVALERGVSGRLKAVRLVGTRKSVIVRKELNIRQAFENLPSALCTFELRRKSGTLNVRGAGRGHGVGMCQQGACGMARADHSYDEILRHYFTGVKITEI